MSLTLSQQNRQGSSIHNDNDARIRPVEKINDNDNDGPHTPKAVTDTCFQNHHGVMMISFQDSLHRFNRVFPTGPARGPILQSSTGTQPRLATLPAQGLVP